jgi:hypothetical protein
MNTKIHWMICCFILEVFYFKFYTILLTAGGIIMECPVCGKSAKIRKKQNMSYSTILHLECSDVKCGFRWVTNIKSTDEKSELIKPVSNEVKNESDGIHVIRKD